MKDLTDGSIAKNILQMAPPIAAALWLAASREFQFIELWYISIASITLQACFNLWLVRGEFRRRLVPPAASNV
jgi:hypothetical protein